MVEVLWRKKCAWGTWLRVRTALIADVHEPVAGAARAAKPCGCDVSGPGPCNKTGSAEPRPSAEAPPRAVRNSARPTPPCGGADQVAAFVKVTGLKTRVGGFLRSST